MLQTILVPLDGSELAERALPLAVGLVENRQGKLVLVRAALSRSFPGADPADGQIRAIDEAEAYLSGVAERLAEEGIAADTAVPYGPAAPAILDEIRIRRPDLVVMATHGRSGLGRWLYGSVAEAVLGHSSTPIMLTRAWHPEQSAAATAAIPRILVPLDGSQFAEAALPTAAELAARVGAELVLFQAIFPPPSVRQGEDGRIAAYVDRDLEDLELDARRYLTDIQQQLNTEQPTVRTRVEVRVGAPVDGIVSASEEDDAAMVVMATHGRTGLGRLFLGSVAGAVLREGDRPLLLVRPRALAPAPSLLPIPADEPAQSGPTIKVALTADEIELVRSALHWLAQSVTRHEHVRPRIQRLLARLPQAETVADQEPVATRS